MVLMLQAEMQQQHVLGTLQKVQEDSTAESHQGLLHWAVLCLCCCPGLDGADYPAKKELRAQVLTDPKEQQPN